MFEDNHITNPVVRRFIGELRRFEQDGDPEALVELFTKDAELSRLDSQQEGRGRNETRAFWIEYRNMFEEVRTQFFNVVEGTDPIEGEDEAALEWHSKATLPDGRPLDYLGVTVINLTGGLIKALRTYYDTAVFQKDSVATD